MKQVFVSHTKKDVEFCDMFDRACARVGIKAFRSEFETIENPPWKTIKDAMNQSVALFFLVGKELVNNQYTKNHNWQYTQNWIAYEIGLACQKGIDVWAICDNATIINFPMPYINNYFPVDFRIKPAFKLLINFLKMYNNGYKFSYPDPYSVNVCCPYNNCKMEFNLHIDLLPKSTIRCPQCLRDITFPEGTS